MNLFGTILGHTLTPTECSRYCPFIRLISTSSYDINRVYSRGIMPRVEIYRPERNRSGVVRIQDHTPSCCRQPFFADVAHTTVNTPPRRVPADVISNQKGRQNLLPREVRT